MRDEDMPRILREIADDLEAGRVVSGWQLEMIAGRISVANRKRFERMIKTGELSPGCSRLLSLPPKRPNLLTD